MSSIQIRAPKASPGKLLDIASSFDAEAKLLGGTLLGQPLFQPVRPLYEQGMIKVSETIYPPGDRQIIQDEAKRECNKRFRERNQRIIWVETQGQLNLTRAAKIGLPIGESIRGQSAFELSSQVRIRRLSPYESPSGLFPKGASFAESINLPLSAQAAMQMPPGSEFELSGTGKINFQIPGQSSIGASAKKNLSLLIQKLPQDDLVSVKLSDAGGREAALVCKSEYSLDWSIGSVGQYLLDKLNLSKWLQPISMGLEASRQNQNRIIKQYIFNLSSPEEVAAYEELVTKFSCAGAEKLNSRRECEEEETSYDIHASAAIGETPLTLFRFSESEKKSSFSRILYQQFTSIREHLSKWFSKMSVIWEWISVQDKNKNSTHSYCHLTFDSPYASDFFEATDMLGISVPSDAKSVLFDQTQTDIHADIYFTDTGIQNIQRSSSEDGFKSYLGRDADSIKNISEAKRYGEIQNKWFFTRWFFIRERLALEAQYPELLTLRNSIQAAEAFAQKINPFQGSLGRFSDMKSIATLIKLAGPQGVKMHDLSISSPLLHLSNPDEGEIKHPEQEATAQLSALSLESELKKSGDRASGLAVHF